MQAKLAIVVTRGRTRKPGEREPNGRKRRDRGDPRDLAVYTRAREAGYRGLLNPYLSSEIGRLELAQRAITQAEASALTALGRHLGRYERLMGFPAPTGRSAAFWSGYKAAPDPTEQRARKKSPELGPFIAEPETIIPADIDRMAKSEKRTHQRLRNAIPTAEAWAMLYAVCAEDRQINPVFLEDLGKFARTLRGIFTATGNRSGTVRSWRAS